MRCQLCMNFSWHLICKNCLNTFLTPIPQKRVLENGLIVYSFYSYDEIKELLHTKHTIIGSNIYSLITKHAILPFIKDLKLEDVYILPIDDHVRSGYSHTAVMAKALSKTLKPIYKSIRAKNQVRYSGQKLYIREKFKRDFDLTCKKEINVILLDDIITSGNTLKEAYSTCRKNNLHVICAITLADAKR